MKASKRQEFWCFVVAMILFLFCFTIVFWQKIVLTVPKTEKVIEVQAKSNEPRLVIAEENQRDLSVKVGDVLLIRGFVYPLTKTSLDNEVEIGLSGDQVLDLVGKSTVPYPESEEGKTCKELIFCVRKIGVTWIIMTLIKEKGNRPYSKEEKIFKVEAK